MILNIILAVVVFLNLSLCFFVFSQNTKALNNRFFFIATLISAIWTFTNFMTGVQPSPFWLQSTYASGAWVISTCIVWILVVVERKLQIKWLVIFGVPALIFSVCSFQSGFIAQSYDQIYAGGVFVGKPGIGLFVYTVIFLVGSGFILWKLFTGQKKTTDVELKSQLNSIFYGTLILVIICAFTSFILPSFSVFSFSGLDSIGLLFFLFFIAYAITKHHLFDIKVIALEVVTFGLWITILIRTLLADTTQERLVEAGLLLITVIFGITLIRSTLHVITQRERIEKLAEKLQKAYASLEDMNEHLERKVASQTHQIIRAYEIEKEARRELEKLDETKNQLITAAQHNLRTPLTALRWQLEVIRKDVGKKSQTSTHNELEVALKESEESVTRLTQVLEDFLEIAALKVGGVDVAKKVL